jgi:hypothetical protein
MKALMLVFFMFCVVSTFAQTNAGNQTLGISAGYSSGKSTTVFSNPLYGPATLTVVNKQAVYSLSPGYSVFLGKTVDVGFAFGILGSVYDYDYGSTASATTPIKTTNKAYSGTFYLRKYILLQDRIGVRTGPFFQYQKSDQVSDYPAGSPLNGDNKNQVISYSGGMYVDFVYYPTRRIGLAANLLNLNYSYSKSVYEQGGGESDNDQKTYSANFLTTNLSLSIYFVLGK